LDGTDYRVPTVAAWSAAEVSPPLGHFIAFVGEWLRAHAPDRSEAER